MGEVDLERLAQCAPDGHGAQQHKDAKSSDTGFLPNERIAHVQHCVVARLDLIVVLHIFRLTVAVVKSTTLEGQRRGGGSGGSALFFRADDGVVGSQEGAVHDIC